MANKSGRRAAARTGSRSQPRPFEVADDVPSLDDDAPPPLGLDLDDTEVEQTITRVFLAVVQHPEPSRSLLVAQGIRIDDSLDDPELDEYPNLVAVPDRADLGDDRSGTPIPSAASVREVLDGDLDDTVDQTVARGIEPELDPELDDEVIELADR